MKMVDIETYRLRVGLFGGGTHFKSRGPIEWREGSWEERIFTLVLVCTLLGGLSCLYLATETLKISASINAIGYGLYHARPAWNTRVYRKKVEYNVLI